MTISFYLCNAERKVSSIKINVSFKKKRYQKTIGESIETSKWSLKKQRSKVTAGDIEAELLNSRLDKWEEACTRSVSYFKDKPYTPDSEEFFKILDSYRFNGDTSTKHISVVEYFDIYIKRYEGVRSLSRIKHFRLARNILTRYQEEVGSTFYFEDLTMDFYTRFESWFYKHGYSTNYFGEQIKIYRQISTEAREVDKISHSNDVHNRNFSAPHARVENIYLTEEELIQLHNFVPTMEMVMEEHPSYDIKQAKDRLDSLLKAKDMFLIGAFTGLRYSDFSRLSKDNFGEHISITASKTRIKSVIPIHWVVREIVERGYDFEHPLYEQKLNKHIKEVAKLAGFTDEIMLTKSESGKPVEVVKPKYECISTHTARRSFATNAYKAGIPTIAIMKVTGHTSEATFLNYIKISEAENADILSKHSFFTDKPKQ